MSKETDTLDRIHRLEETVTALRAELHSAENLLHQLKTEVTFSETLRKASEETGDFESLPVDKLPLSARTVNSLIGYGGIRTVGELLKKTPEDILGIRNIGQRSLDEIKATMAAFAELEQPKG